MTMDKCHFTLVQFHRMDNTKSQPNVHCELWVSGDLSAMQQPQETWIQPVSQKDPLVEKMTSHSSILDGEIPWTEQPGALHPQGHKELDMTEVTQQTRTGNGPW